MQNNTLFLQKSNLSILLSFLLRYKLKIFFGFVFILFATITNLILLGGLTPIFNLLGNETNTKVFQISTKENTFVKENISKTKLSEFNNVADFINFKIISYKIKINNYFINYTNKKIILIICLLIIPLYFIKLFLLTAGVYFMGTMGLSVVRDIRKELYEKLLRINLNYLNKEKTGIIMSKVINDGEEIAQTLSVKSNEMLVDFFYIITHIGFLFWISWKMTIILFTILPIMVIPINIIAKKIRKTIIEQQKSFGELISHLQELVSGIRVIRMFGMEAVDFRNFRNNNQRLYKNTYLTHFYHQIAPLVSEFIVTSLVLFFFVWGANEMTKTDLSRGLFLTFFFIILFIIRPLKKISIGVNSLTTATAASGRIFEILKEEDAVADALGDTLGSSLGNSLGDSLGDNIEDLAKVNINKNKKIKEILIKEKGNIKKTSNKTSINEKDLNKFNYFKDQIEFNNVSFSYTNDQNLILDNISFKVKHGDNIAIVGKSGSGKTTLMELLMRLYEVKTGEIKIDEINIKDISLKNLRSNIALVSQDIFLFHSSVADNISCSNKNISREKIEEVAKQSYAHEFIKLLPQGYDTIVGDRGVMLSGGQRQRIAIARTLLINPQILILDEATSSLDNESEFLIQKEIEKLTQNRTVFTIAHRLSTLNKLSQILVLEKGKIVETGLHEELMQKKGLYYNLYTN